MRDAALLRDDTRIGDLLAQLQQALEPAGIPMARQEARDIIAAVMNEARFWPTLHRDAAISEEHAEAAREAARLRARGAPFAYAVGRAAFRHLVLEVDERVLIPRQETELLVDLVLEAMPWPGGVAVDVGTGSGAIALALAAEGRFERVTATDVSRGALAVARRNASRCAASLRAPIELRHGASLAPLGDVRARVVVSNPPYIAYEEARELPASVRDWEPAIALLSADSGLRVTRAIVQGAPDILETSGLLALEVDSRRAARVAALIGADGRYTDVAVRTDLTGRERFVLARSVYTHTR